MPGADEQLLLAVDACSGHSSIALARGGETMCELLGQVELAAEWTSTALHVEIARLLALHQVRTADITAYAVTNGPGSFTSVRVGTAAVKGLAEVHGKPVAAVSTLALIAQAAAWGDDAAWSEADSGALGAAVWIPILDARRAQVFGGLYRRQSAALELLEPETVCALRELIEKCRALGDVPVRFCSPDIAPFAETIAAEGNPRATALAVPTALAGTLARMGLQVVAHGGGVGAIAVDANYIRASDAELFWKG